MTAADWPEVHAAVLEARRQTLADALDALDDVRQRWYGADARAALTEAEDALLRLMDESKPEANGDTEA